MPMRENPANRPPRAAGMGDYLKEAFLFRWNLLILLGGAAPTAGRDVCSTPGRDRLLWLCLGLLLSKAALDRFLQSMDEQQIAARLTELRKTLETAKGGDDRIVRSLQDSVASTELRLDNYTRAKKNAQFVSIELD